MSWPHFTCVKTGKHFPFALNVFNNPEANSPSYSNLIMEGWYEVEWYLSRVPFKQIHVSYGAKNTPLIQYPHAQEILWLPNLMVKDESHNPYGTHKDRRSEYIINVALEHHVDKIVCLTAGNAWYSLSRYCARAHIDYTSLIFPWVSAERRDSLSYYGHSLIIDWNRNAWILRFRWFKEIIQEYDKYERWLEWKNIRAVTNSFEPISVNAYKELFYEIKDEQPDYVVLPCGSGDIIVGVRLAIKELGMSTKIIAVWPKDEHPLKNALRFGVDEYQIEHYHEQSIAEKLSTPFSAVLPILYKIFNEPGNMYFEVDNTLIQRTKEVLSFNNKIKFENSAVPPFAVFLAHERPNIDPQSKVIIINTGKWLEN